MIINYSPIGTPVSDWNVENLFNGIRLCQSPECVFDFSTENIFNRIRLAVVRGEMDCHDVVFMFNGEVIELNKYGVYQESPSGFLDFSVNMIESILTTQIKKYGEERNGNKVSSS